MKWFHLGPIKPMRNYFSAKEKWMSVNITHVHNLAVSLKLRVFSFASISSEVYLEDKLT